MNKTLLTILSFAILGCSDKSKETSNASPQKISQHPKYKIKTDAESKKAFSDLLHLIKYGVSQDETNKYIGSFVSFHGSITAHAISTNGDIQLKTDNDIDLIVSNPSHLLYSGTTTSVRGDGKITSIDLNKRIIYIQGAGAVMHRADK